jgi:hypothetical protein
MDCSFLKGGGFFSGLLHCCAVRNDCCDFAIPLRHCEGEAEAIQERKLVTRRAKLKQSGKKHGLPRRYRGSQ